MFHQIGSITGDGELIIKTNTESRIMAFDWFVTDPSNEVITIPAGISINIFRRQLNSIRTSSESWEDFASNPFDAQITSITDTYLSTDAIKLVISGLGTNTLNVNIHQSSH